MPSTLTVILLILAILVCVFIYFKYLKPYSRKFDRNICYIGSNGSGKTCDSVLDLQILIRKQILIHYTFYNLFQLKIGNTFRKLINKIVRSHNRKVNKKNKGKQWKEINLKQKRLRPVIYSNMPMRYKPFFFKKDFIMCKRLSIYHLTLLQPMIEYSIWFIDEIPQFLSQFDWNLEIVKTKVNELITFHRHYYDSYFVCTAQSDTQVVKQLREKLNHATWCVNFKKHLFGLFFTVECMDMMLSENLSSYSTSQIEDNTKKMYRFFPKKNSYATRCYKYRIKNSYLDEKGNVRKETNTELIKRVEGIFYKEYEKEKALLNNPSFKTYFEKLIGELKDSFLDIYTNEILRFTPYISPLDDKTTQAQKQTMYNELEKYKTSKEE